MSDGASCAVEEEASELHTPAGGRDAADRKKEMEDLNLVASERTEPWSYKISLRQIIINIQFNQPPVHNSCAPQRKIYRISKS